MKVVVFAGLATSMLAGCAAKATLCDSEYMRAQMKAKFAQDVNERYYDSGVDLFAAGLVSNVRYENIETDFAGGNGNAAVCRATLRFDVAGKTIEDDIGYLVVSQSGKDMFRNYGRWPMERLEAALMAGPMGELWKKEREIRHLEAELTPEERAALGASREQQLKAAEAALVEIRKRIQGGAQASRAASAR
ncbi:MAG TPA: hypothetical protein PK789_07790 [Thermomonas sp.]|jgi:hypothetical protein|uniref:hypothetical protein n=1 Tax=Thermomonas sp. TaxID=1971895 RepID=UPI002C5CA763|nr:hypothetical protein [Thermomonas sp.]HOV96653.1 hypothetical protein [Thermomonas sp.]